MRTINLYTFHKGVISERFDNHSTRYFISHLEKMGYKVNWYEMCGGDKFVYKNDCEVLIDQGSISIIEFDDTKQFKTFDFGDAPTLSIKLSKSKNFIGASIGQYNEKLWDETIKDSNLRKNINAGPYPETLWQFGMENYDNIQSYRNGVDLNTALCWRGSIYENPNQAEYKCREYIKILANMLKGDFYFGNYPIKFDDYIYECVGFKLVLCSGVGGGYICGDHCLRDIELYGLGIPTIRPKYVTKNFDPLIPDYHYISVDVELDEKCRYKNQEKLASDLCEKYRKVINDNEFLKYIAKNAREWYVNNLSYPNITNNIIKSLNFKSYNTKEIGAIMVNN